MLDDANNRSLAGLPYELERDIFELTARAHPGSAPQLALVCGYVQTWVEAVMYETIVLGQPSAKQTLFWRTFAARPPAFFAKNIRALHLATGVSDPRVGALLAVCTDLAALTCWAANPLATREALLDRLSGPGPMSPLRHLSINAATLWPRADNLTHRLFARLTHLELVNPPAWFDWAPLLAPGALPRLTHLALGDLDAAHAASVLDTGFFRDALASDAPGPRLEMLIAVSQNEYFLYALERERAVVEEARFVCLPSYHYPWAPTEYWDAVARKDSEVQFWRRREKRVVEKSAV
ncbi:hypothetical protein GGX14DRAFT_696956 [Mycena pura]|uniref:Uncharacterized protein n=1 Tax=Mycena pura TaxID=153505 RepID=A0AAD6VHG0_9AGAR|nr:hypothetical protein GGX14DRAFT_696956 [Mycena pura]